MIHQSKCAGKIWKILLAKQTPNPARLQFGAPPYQAVNHPLWKEVKYQDCSTKGSYVESWFCISWIPCCPEVSFLSDWKQGYNLTS